MSQSLTNLLMHIVFSTNERQPFLADPALRDDMHRYLGGIVKGKGGVALAVGGVADHVHLLVVSPKTMSVSDLIRDTKRSSSMWVKSHAPSLKGFAWQGGYGAFSVGQTETKAAIAYIRNQAEHHRTRSFQEEYLGFLIKYGIVFDERFVWE